MLKGVLLMLKVLTVCWFHGPRIISAASNVVFWTFFRAKTCLVICNPYCFFYGRTNMAHLVWENHRTSPSDLRNHFCLRITFAVVQIQPVRFLRENHGCSHCRSTTFSNFESDMKILFPEWSIDSVVKDPG